jgi:hypothetical protein
MRVKLQAWALVLGAAVCGVLLSNCGSPYGSSGGGGGSVPVTPTPSASPTFSPGPCGTPNTSDPNLVMVGMANAFAAVTVAPYGKIGGYAVVDPSGASPAPQTAGIISMTVSGAPITSANTLQFTNLENPGSIVHSAYGFSGDAFPRDYRFPSPAPSPTATAITSGNWFTGLVPSLSTAQCFSQTFSLKPGTYYFGDYSYYNLTTFEDVLVVSTPAPTGNAQRVRVARPGDAQRSSSSQRR